MSEVNSSRVSYKFMACQGNDEDCIELSDITNKVYEGTIAVIAHHPGNTSFFTFSLSPQALLVRSVLLPRARPVLQYRVLQHQLEEAQFPPPLTHWLLTSL